MAEAQLAPLSGGAEMVHSSARQLGGGGSVLDGSAFPSQLSLFLVQVILIISLSRALALLLRPLKQPAVVAEMLAGIILGPTVMGKIPHFLDTVFPASSQVIIQVIANFALIFFMFLVGLELDTKKLRADLKAASVISAVGILVPFGASLLLAILFNDPEFSNTSFIILAIFITCAIGMSALPVLARILSERRMLSTRLGTLSMTVAAVDDVLGWVLLAIVLAIIRSTSQLGALWTVLLAIAEILFMFFVTGPVLRFLVKRDKGHTHLGAGTFLALCLVLIACSYFAEIIGLSALIGAFQVGLLIPRTSDLSAHLSEKIEYFTVVILMPLFFTASGLKTQFGLINDGRAGGLCILVIVVATVAKIIGIILPCASMGFDWKTSGIVAVLMSCKGLIALIVVNYGAQYNIITEKFFAILVLMVLITTIQTTPLLVLVDPPFSYYKIFQQIGLVWFCRVTRLNVVWRVFCAGMAALWRVMPLKVRTGGKKARDENAPAVHDEVDGADSAAHRGTDVASAADVDGVQAAGGREGERTSLNVAIAGRAAEHEVIHRHLTVSDAAIQAAGLMPPVLPSAPGTVDTRARLRTGSATSISEETAEGGPASPGKRSAMRRSHSCSQTSISPPLLALAGPVVPAFQLQSDLELALTTDCTRLPMVPRVKIPLPNACVTPASTSGEASEAYASLLAPEASKNLVREPALAVLADTGALDTLIRAAGGVPAVEAGAGATAGSGTSGGTGVGSAIKTLAYRMSFAVRPRTATASPAPRASQARTGEARASAAGTQIAEDICRLLPIRTPPAKEVFMVMDGDIMHDSAKLLAIAEMGPQVVLPVDTANGGEKPARKYLPLAALLAYYRKLGLSIAAGTGSSMPVPAFNILLAVAETKPAQGLVTVVNAFPVAVARPATAVPDSSNVFQTPTPLDGPRPFANYGFPALYPTLHSSLYASAKCVSGPHPLTAGPFPGYERVHLAMAWLLGSVDMPSSYMNPARRVEDIRDVTLSNALDRCKFRSYGLKLNTFLTTHPLADAVDEAAKQQSNLLILSSQLLREDEEASTSATVAAAPGLSLLGGVVQAIGSAFTTSGGGASSSADAPAPLPEEQEEEEEHEDAPPASRDPEDSEAFEVAVTVSSDEAALNEAVGLGRGEEEAPTPEAAAVPPVPTSPALVSQALEYAMSDLRRAMKAAAGKLTTQSRHQDSAADAALGRYGHHTHMSVVFDWGTPYAVQRVIVPIIDGNSNSDAAVWFARRLDPSIDILLLRILGLPSSGPLALAAMAGVECASGAAADSTCEPSADGTPMQRAGSLRGRELRATSCVSSAASGGIAGLPTAGPAFLPHLPVTPFPGRDRVARVNVMGAESLEGCSGEAPMQPLELSPAAAFQLAGISLSKVLECSEGHASGDTVVITSVQMPTEQEVEDGAGQGTSAALERALETLRPVLAACYANKTTTIVVIPPPPALE